MSDAATSKFSNPAPLGLAGFALTTWLLSMINAGWFGGESMGMVLACALAYGGTAQAIAGVMELPRGNSFGATAFLSYGAFWWSFALGVSSIEQNDRGNPIDGAEEVAGGLVVAGGDGPVLLEFGEEVLDQVPILVQHPVVVPLHFACAGTLGLRSRDYARAHGISWDVGLDIQGCEKG